MKKALLGTILLGLMFVAPVPTIAGVNIGIGISLPPIVLSGPPHMVVMPETYDVYVVPDIEAELFFWNGWWWRPWGGRWYRSHYYDRGWTYYNHVPSFYFQVDPGWRRHYRNHTWNGRRWNYTRIPHRELERDWKTWDNNRHWEREKNRGAEQYHPGSQQRRGDLRNQRDEQNYRRSEVQQHHRNQGPRQQQHSQPRGR